MGSRRTSQSAHSADVILPAQRSARLDTSNSRTQWGSTYDHHPRGLCRHHECSFSTNWLANRAEVEAPAFARAIRQRAPIHQEEHSLTRGASGLIQKSPSGACLINARPTCRESCGTPLQSVSLRFVALGNVLLVGRHGLVRLAARYPPES
jgi:hypothetical protein